MKKKAKKKPNEKKRVYPGRLIAIPYTREFPGPEPYSLAIKRFQVPIQDAIVNAVRMLKVGRDSVKLPHLITDLDRCQRGPNGRPLVRVTPGVPFQTMQEWDAVDKKRA
ncbi:MAG: hypothetical protein KKH61_06605, partial [Gammaproteobacteria bacterium]|nr:hypothetical protein [Gammaproteobacteria bacterium]